jgi:hypothetical protein
MTILLLLAAAFGAWRAGSAALQSLRGLPRRNEDMVFY